MEEFDLQITNVTATNYLISSVETGDNYIVPVSVVNEIKEYCNDSKEEAFKLIINLKQKINNYNYSLDNSGLEALNISYEDINSVLTRLLENYEYSYDMVEIALDKLTEGAVGVLVEKTANSKMSLSETLYIIIVKIIQDEYCGIATIDEMFFKNQKQYIK